MDRQQTQFIAVGMHGRAQQQLPEHLTAPPNVLNLRLTAGLDHNGRGHGGVAAGLDLNAVNM